MLCGEPRPRVPSSGSPPWIPCSAIRASSSAIRARSSSVSSMTTGSSCVVSSVICGAPFPVVPANVAPSAGPVKAVEGPAAACENRPPFAVDHLRREEQVVPPSYLMPDVIVCIPGITGSVLRKDNRDIWNVSGSAIFNALRTLGDDLQELKLEEDPIDVDDVDGITAPSVIRDIHLIPGIWKIDGYTKLVKHIEEKFDVKHGENLFEFPYDWRRDNRVSSRQLATRAQGWLRAWRQKSGHKDAKLIVIGHSMGGLIAR